MAGMTRATIPALDLAMLGGLVAWNVVQNRVERRTYGRLNAAGSALVVAVGRATGSTWDDLGLGPGSWRRGVQLGAPVAAMAAGVMTAAGARHRNLFRDERVERVSPAELALETLFRIPVGTAVFEELVFRGAAWGRLAARSGVRRAHVISSAIFGLWHILPTLNTLRVYRRGRWRRTPLLAAVAVAAAVGATGTAGIGLALLRRHSRSVVAPIIVHAVVNGTGYVLAWLAAPPQPQQHASRA